MDPITTSTPIVPTTPTVPSTPLPTVGHHPGHNPHFTHFLVLSFLAVLTFGSADFRNAVSSTFFYAVTVEQVSAQVDTDSSLIIQSLRANKILPSDQQYKIGWKGKSLPLVTVTNSSATLGSAISKNNVISGYNAYFGFTIVNSGNVDLYISISTLVAFDTNNNTSSGGLMSFGLSSTTPKLLVGDIFARRIIPAGTSRSFVYKGTVIKNQGGTAGVQVFKVTAIKLNYVSQNTEPLIVTSGTEGLTLTATFGDTTLTPPCHIFTTNLTIGNTGADVIALQRFLMQRGFATNSGDETVTGYFGALTKAAVMLYQTSIGQPATGFVGPLTRATLNACGPTIPSIEVKNPPVINGITAPTSLKIGETGTWSVNVTNPENGILRYAVDWGDMCHAGDNCLDTTRAPVVGVSSQLTSTFTHSYSKPGNYTIVFTVMNVSSNGLGAQKSVTVQVNPTVLSVSGMSCSVFVDANRVPTFTFTGKPTGGSSPYSYYVWNENGPLYQGTVPANKVPGTWGYIQNQVSSTFKTYLAVTSGNNSLNVPCAYSDSTTQPSSFSVISPNGGEKWMKESTQTIKWTAPVNVAAAYVDIKLVTIAVPCIQGTLCPLATSYLIASNVSVDNHSYDWKVGTIKMDITAPNGPYTVQICYKDSIVCDASDSYFTISSWLSTCYIFSSNLTIGNTGADVIALQRFLMQRGFATNSGDETVTGYFGALTKAAVMLYQTSIGQPATGFVGPLTRATLNACGPIVVTTPSITVLSPNGGESFKLGGTISGSFTTNKPIGTSCDVAIVRSMNNTSTTVIDSTITYVKVADSYGQGFQGVIPNNIPIGNDYKIRVVCGQDSSFVQDQSDSSFTITSDIVTPPTVSEQVKCVFNGSNGTEKCYTVTDSNTSDWFSCTGTGTCVASVKGLKGSQLTWKSSCESKNLPITTTDGNNEYINFNCGSIVTTTPVSKPIYINAGGSVAGNFIADKYFTGGKTYSITNKIDTSAVSNPAPQSVYQTERYGESATYSIPDLNPGSKYSVVLDFSENYVNGPNQRVFNVSLNDNQVITNFDIFKEAGAQYKAIQKTFVTVADSLGKITITFKSLKNAAKIDGISIVPMISGTNSTDHSNTGESSSLGAAVWDAMGKVNWFSSW